MQKILIIAGSDSGAGAGIQADIKSAAANGVYASTAITSITAQNTLGVQAVYNLPDDIIFQQINSVLSDIGASVIKTGMLSTEGIIKVVARAISESRIQSSEFRTVTTNHQLPTTNYLVCDPVMIAKGGHKLLDDEAITALKNLIISKAYLVTPNIPEAEVLSGIKIHNENDMIKAGEVIITETGCGAVLVKGGHMEGEILIDILIQKAPNHSTLNSQPSITQITSPRINTKNTHGTGCSYATAIAANLAKGQELEQAVKNANEYIHNAIKSATSIGSGHSPINHFWK